MTRRNLYLSPFWDNQSSDSRPGAAKTHHHQYNSLFETRPLPTWTWPLWICFNCLILRISVREVLKPMWDQIFPFVFIPIRFHGVILLLNSISTSKLRNIYCLMFHLSFIRFQAVSLTVSHESVKVNIMPETKILRLVFINMYVSF